MSLFRKQVTEKLSFRKHLNYVGQDRKYKVYAFVASVAPACFARRGRFYPR